MAMKGYFAFSQSSSINGVSPSDCLMSYPGHSLGGRSYSSAEIESVYFTAPANWATFLLIKIERNRLTWFDCINTGTQILIHTHKFDFKIFCNVLFLNIHGILIVSLFNDISTFVGYSMPKPFSKKNNSGTIYSYSWEDKGVHTSPKDICLEVNVIARLEFELTY